MAPDEPAKPAPVLLRIKLRYDDVETMVQRFAPNVGKAGLFLPTKSMQPIGAEVKFELKLANDTPVIVGLGRVKHIRPPDPANPRAVVGIGIELMRVTRESRDVIMKMLERRRQMGLAETALPTADEIDAARRDVDTGLRGPTPPPVMLDPVIEPLLTAPRRASGPIAVQKVIEEVADVSRPVMMPAVLAPEPSRRHVRRSLDELIASAAPAASISADMFGGADEVDVRAVLARARMLAAGTDLDAELDALRESSAAPIEITVEAASAELARALGGTAVSRTSRAVSWAVPPPSAPAPAVTEVEPPRDEEPVPQKSVAATALAALVGDERVESRSFIEQDVDDHDEGEEHEIGDDLVEAEEPIEDPFDALDRRAAEALVPTIPEEIITEPRNDAVGSGLLIDDDVDPAMFESGDDPMGGDERTQFAPLPLPDIDGNARLDAALAQAEAAGDADEDFGFPSEPIEEVDDFEILTEADLDDDLVADLGAGREGTEGDFVARLELSNEHSAIADDPQAEFHDRDSVMSFGDVPGVDPLAGFADDQPSERPQPYRHDYVQHGRIQHVQAAAVPQAVWDPMTGQYVDPDRPVYAAAPKMIEGDLEDALEALDVDLDELGGPQLAPDAHTRPHQRTPSRPVRVPRATSERSGDDGILIDFDDDD